MLPELTDFNGWAALVRDPRIGGWLQTGALIAARVMPLVFMTPIFGGQALPARVRLGLGVLFAAVFWPLLGDADGLRPTATFALLLVKEAAVGVMLAFLVLVMIEAVAAVGMLVDLSRGAAMGSLLDPQSHQSHSPLGAFHAQLATALLLALGGHRIIIEALGNSLGALPLSAFAPPNLLGPGAIAGTIALVGEMLWIALRLAAPAVAAAVLLDAGLGLANRLAQRIEIYFLGLPLKAVAGLLCVAAALGVTVELVTAWYADQLRLLFGLFAS